MIALYLSTGRTTCAFDALERAKSQVLLSYLANREQSYWARGDEYNHTLMEELNHLRAEHQWFYSLAHEPQKINDRHNVNTNTLSPEQALIEVAVREQRIRSITEQLYLHSGDEYQMKNVVTTSLNEIQNVLQEGTVLVEFYNNGVDLWAFVIDQRTIRACPLPVTIETINQLLAQLKTNIASALRIDHRTDAAPRLAQLARRILKRLHSQLIEPLGLDQYDPQKVLIVPYGVLHFLPFHILYDGSAHMLTSSAPAPA